MRYVPPTQSPIPPTAIKAPERRCFFSRALDRAAQSPGTTYAAATPSVDPRSSMINPISSSDDVAATDSHGAGRNKLHDAYGINAFKSLARSHPAVFARHHPDLVVLPDGTVVEKCWGTLG